jgi:hypothetical protein
VRPFGFQKLSKDELKNLDATELMSNRSNQAHIEYYFEAAYYPSFPVPQYPPNASEGYISITAGLLAPVSRGNITLQSNSISDVPIINLNVSKPHQILFVRSGELTGLIQYLQEDTDQKIAVYAFKQLRKILAYPKLAAWGIGQNNGEVVPGETIQSDAEILE